MRVTFAIISPTASIARARQRIINKICHVLMIKYRPMATCPMLSLSTSLVGGGTFTVGELPRLKPPLYILTILKLLSCRIEDSLPHTIGSCVFEMYQQMAIFCLL